MTLIYHGQLSLREVITRKWIHAEICTLLANTLRRLRQVITPRRIHFEPMLLASLACSLRSRPQAASRPSASRMPGVSKITTGFLIYNLWDPYFRTATNFLGFHKISLIKAWILCLGIFSSHKITQKICIGKLRQYRSTDPLTSSCTLLNAHDYVPSYEIFSSTYQYIVLVLVQT